MTDQVRLIGGRKLFAHPAHHLLKDSFDMNRRIWYPSLTASTENIRPNFDYTETGTKCTTRADASRAHLLPKITTVHQSSAYRCNSESMGPNTHRRKSCGHRVWKEPGLLSKGPNLPLDLDMGFWKEDLWGFKSQLSHLSPSASIEAAKVKVLR